MLRLGLQPGAASPERRRLLSFVTILTTLCGQCPSASLPSCPVTHPVFTPGGSEAPQIGSGLGCPPISTALEFSGLREVWPPGAPLSGVLSRGSNQRCAA